MKPGVPCASRPTGVSPLRPRIAELRSPSLRCPWVCDGVEMRGKDGGGGREGEEARHGGQRRVTALQWRPAAPSSAWRWAARHLGVDEEILGLEIVEQHPAVVQVGDDADDLLGNKGDLGGRHEGVRRRLGRPAARARLKARVQRDLTQAVEDEVERPIEDVEGIGEGDDQRMVARRQERPLLDHLVAPAGLEGLDQPRPLVDLHEVREAAVALDDLRNGAELAFGERAHLLEVLEGGHLALAHLEARM